jgi:hypothetical protein
MPGPKPVGSRRISASGYIQIKTEMGIRRWPWEHHVVWIAVNGPMPDGSVIHHKNGIKTDNRLENLELVGSSGDHTRHHHPPTETARQKMSRARKGRPHSPEHSAAIAAALRGKPKSPEHRRKIVERLASQSEKNRGSKRTPETRAKMSASLKRFWQEKRERC